MLFYSDKVKNECLADPELYVMWGALQTPADRQEIVVYLKLYSQNQEWLDELANREHERFLNFKNKIANLKKEYLEVADSDKIGQQRAEQKRIVAQRHELRKKNIEIAHLHKRILQLRRGVCSIGAHSTEPVVKEVAKDIRDADYNLAHRKLK